MNEARNQMRMFCCFLDGRQRGAELSPLPVLMLVQVVARFILEQSQIKVFEGIFFQTRTVKRGIVTNDWNAL